MCPASGRQTDQIISQLITVLCTDAADPGVIPRTSHASFNVCAAIAEALKLSLAKPIYCPSGRKACTGKAQPHCPASRMAGHPAPPLPWTACRVPAEQHRIDQGFCKHRSLEKHWLRSLPKTSSLPEKSIACRCHLAWGTRYIFILGCVWGPEYLLISQTEKHCFLVRGKLLFAGRNRTILPLDQICK